MLLAGDPVVVGIESAVLRGRGVVEASAALEVCDRVCPAACVVVGAQPPDSVGVPRVDVRAVGPPGGSSGPCRMSAGPKTGQNTKGDYGNSSDYNGSEQPSPLWRWTIESRRGEAVGQ
jgi:hypothetical protein